MEGVSTQSQDTLLGGDGGGGGVSPNFNDMNITMHTYTQMLCFLVVTDCPNLPL